MRTLPLQAEIDKARRNLRATKEDRELQREAVEMLIGARRKLGLDYSYYVEMIDDGPQDSNV